jgi:ATPase subunit of ABC transporter with duplicated ATPase domains
MSLISLLDIGVVTPRPLFQNLTFRFGPGDRVGLIAANGGGKSTLLRCIAGTTAPDAGIITLSRGLRVGHVEQDIPAALLPLPFLEAVRRALPPARREHDSWRVGAVLDEFETPENLRELPVAALSGGWQRMALLMRVWITERPHPDADRQPRSRISGQLHHANAVFASRHQPRLCPLLHQRETPAGGG